MSLFRSKRSVPTPEPTVSHGSTNPMFISSGERLAALRSIAVWTLSTVAIGAAIGAWAYGPYFHISSVTVDGTKVVRSESVRAWVEHDIHRLRWLIIPQDHSILLSTKSLSGRLHYEINKRLSVESVTVTTPDRHSLAVTIVERQAVLVWASGDQRTTLDKHGVVIGPLTLTESAPYPLVEDQTKLPTPTDATIASPDLVKGFTTLSEEAKNIGLTVDRFILPVPRCVLSNANSNANIPVTNSENTNSVNANIKNSNLNGNSNSNQNGNTNSGVDLTIGTCQNATARLNASDIWLQVSKGPVIYFDRHQDLRQAMDAVRRAYEDPKNRTVRYIDARFPGRLYIQ